MFQWIQISEIRNIKDLGRQKNLIQSMYLFFVWQKRLWIQTHLYKQFNILHWPRRKHVYLQQSLNSKIFAFVYFLYIRKRRVNYMQKRWKKKKIIVQWGQGNNELKNCWKKKNRYFFLEILIFYKIRPQGKHRVERRRVGGRNGIEGVGGEGWGW